MTNEIKLLTAFIKASGFDVEEIDNSFDLYHKLERHHDGKEKLASGGFDRTIVRTDYKVTKETPDVFIEVNDDGHSQVLSKPRELDFCTYPTQFKISIVDGVIEVFKVGKLDEWEQLNEKI